MKYRILLYILFCFFHGKYFAQNGNRFFSQSKETDCNTVTINSVFHISEYYFDNQIDSSEIMCKNWIQKCGKNEYNTTALLLLSILQGNFSEDIYDEDIISYLLDYKCRKTDNYYLSQNGMNFYSTHDQFLMAISEKINADNCVNKLEKFFVLYFSGKFSEALILLKSPNLHHTKLQKYYFSELGKISSLPKFNAALYTGAWLPQGCNKILGNHPFIGFLFGFVSNKITYDLTMDFRFGKTPKPYKINYLGDIIETNYFFGAYVGFELDRELYSYQNNKISLLLGIALDGFDCIDQATIDQYSENYSVISTNFNLGLGYRYCFKNQCYIGLQTRYNYVNYKNPEGSDLSGNTLSIRLLYGFSGNRYRASELKNLDIIER